MSADAPNRPTQTEWEHIEAALWPVLGCAELLIDGYRVTFARRQVSERETGIMFFIDGHFQGSWLSEDCEQRRRFCRERTRYVWRESVRREYRNKKARFTLITGSALNKKMTDFLPWWPTFKALKRHLLAHNRDIELVRHSGVHAHDAAKSA